MAWRTCVSRSFSENGFSRTLMSAWRAPWVSRMDLAYPDMYKTGRPGRTERTLADTSVPSMSGMITSVSSRSTGSVRSLAWRSASAGVVAVQTW